jgi:hypothetical protein
MNAMNVLTKTMLVPTGHVDRYFYCNDGTVEYQTDYDLTALMHNLAIAGALAAAWYLGNVNGAEWWQGRKVRTPFGPKAPQ